MSEERKFCAFRLVWIGKACPNLEEVWSNIVHYQQNTDSRLQMIPGIEFFLSAVTATVTVTAGVAEKDVKPALAYWVGGRVDALQDAQLYISMRSNTFGATLKLMTHKTARNEHERQLNNLAMAVKDFGQGFVQSKVNSVSGGGYEPIRLYMKEAKSPYFDTLRQACPRLAEAGLGLHVEHF